MRSNLASPLLCITGMLRCIPIFALTLAACGGGYRANSFHGYGIWGGAKFEGTRLTQGCFDVSLRARENDKGDPTLDVNLGNRCVQAQKIHLGRLRIQGYFDDGAPRHLSLYDPKREIRRALLGGQATAHERFEISGGQGANQLCVSLDEVFGGITGPPSQTCVPVEAGDEA